VDAPGGSVVRPFGPGVELVAHDVAVGAGLRIGREIAEAFGVAERERADASRDSNRRRERERGTPWPLESQGEHGAKSSKSRACSTRKECASSAHAAHRKRACP